MVSKLKLILFVVLTVSFSFVIISELQGEYYHSFLQSSKPEIIISKNEAKSLFFANEFKKIGLIDISKILYDYTLKTYDSSWAFWKLLLIHQENDDVNTARVLFDEYNLEITLLPPDEIQILLFLGDYDEAREIIEIYLANLSPGDWSQIKFFTNLRDEIQSKQNQN